MNLEGARRPTTCGFTDAASAHCVASSARPGLIEYGRDRAVIQHPGGGRHAASQEARHVRVASARGVQRTGRMKRLNSSLDAAQEALAELRKDTGRDVSQGARDLYKDLRAFISSARRDSSKLAKALARDLEQAEKRLASSTSGTRTPTRTTSRRPKTQTSSRRSTSKPS